MKERHETASAWRSVGYRKMLGETGRRALAGALSLSLVASLVPVSALSAAAEEAGVEEGPVADVVPGEPDAPSTADSTESELDTPAPTGIPDATSAREADESAASQLSASEESDDTYGLESALDEGVNRAGVDPGEGGQAAVPSSDVDTTPLQASVAFDESEAPLVEGGSIYDQRTMTVRVTGNWSVLPENPLVSVTRDGVTEEQDPEAAWEVHEATGDEPAYAQAIFVLVDEGVYQRVRVRATDGVNSLDEEFDAGFTIDSRAPEVSIEIDGVDAASLDPTAPTYTNASVATVTVDDVTFDPDASTVESNGAVGSWDAHACEVDLAEGVVRLGVVARDAVGRESVAAIPEGSLVVDRTAPRVSATGMPDDGAQVNETQTVTITVDEENWDDEHPLLVGRSNGAYASLPDAAWEDAGNGTHTCALELAGEGVYGIRVSGTDRAGNEVEWESTTFTIDRTAPKIDMELDPAVEEGGYASGAVTATITVVEPGWSEELIAVDLGSGGAHDPEQVTHLVWEEGPEEGVHTCRLTLTNDGVYSLVVRGSDLAGNEAEAYSCPTFTIDTTPPEVTNDFSRQVRRLDPAVYKGVAYFSDRVAVTTTVRDRNLDTSRTTIVAPDGRTLPFDEAPWKVSDPDAEGVVTYTCTFLYEDRVGGNRTPRVRARDLAGNGEELTGAPFVVDLAAPRIDAVTASARPSAEARHRATDDPVQFFNRPTTLTFEVSDEHLLNSVTLYDPDGQYEVGEIERGVGSARLRVSLVDGTQSGNDTEFERRDDHLIYLTVSDIAGNLRTWTLDRTGKVVDEFDSSAANASLDGLGVFPISLVLDATAPVVALSGAEEGAFYAEPRTIRADVNEFNFSYLQEFDPTSAVVTVTSRAGSASGETSTQQVSVSSFEGTRPSYSYEQELAADGHYVVSAQLTDPAGNTSGEAVIGEFTIDGTPPVIEVTWDNEDVRNGRYYNAPRTATITITEHNFDAARVNVTTTGSVQGWSSSGDTHTCTVSFGDSAGASHNLKVSATDLAGNEAIAYESPEFVIDTVAPTVTIGGVAQRLGDGGYEGAVQDGAAYNGVVAPEVLFADDANLDTMGYSWTLTGNKHGTETTDVTSAVASHEGNEIAERFEDFGLVAEGVRGGRYVDDYDVDADDIYTLTAHVSDLAGNEADAQVTFSVNRYGSNYIVELPGLAGDDKQAFEATGMLASSPTVVVREINVSGATSEAQRGVDKEFASVTDPIAHVDEGDGEGYRLDEPARSQTPYGWAEYNYTIRSANFGEGSSSDHDDGGQGIYRVNVSSADDAGNANSTADYWASDEQRASAAAKAGTVEFILDEVGPAIDHIDLPVGTVVAGEYQASFHVSDEITSGNVVEVLLDGEPVEVTGPASGAGTFTFTIPARSFSRRSVEIRVSDYAGRSATAEPQAFLLTNLHAEGAAGLAAVVLAVGVFLYLRHRRAIAEPEYPVAGGDA